MEAIGRLSCEAFLETIRQDARFYAEFVNGRVIVSCPGDAKVLAQMQPHNLSPAARARVEAMGPLKPQDVVMFWAQGQIATQGPKVFRPTLEQCLAMEQVAPRIALADYVQPYPVMLVELPEDYRRLRVCPARNSRFVGLHAPVFVLTAFPPFARPSLALHVVFGTGTNSTLTVSPDSPSIEDTIVRTFGEESYILVDSPTPEESVVLAGLFRMAANAMLLLVEYGCKPLGPANPTHYQRLERHLAVARKRRQRVAEAEHELKLATQLFMIDQDIVLHDETSSRDGEPGESKGSRRPHWRRGHWKMDVHGTGRSLRKRAFCKPVLVNAHLVARKEVAPITMYQLR